MAARRSPFRTIGLFVIVGAIIVTFVLFFGQPTAQDSVGPVAEVDGVPITRDLFEIFREQTEQRMEGTLPANSDPDESRNLLDQLTVQSLVRRYALAREAEALGLQVSDAEIREQILANPNFRRDGRYDRELLEISVRRQGFASIRDYTEEIRRDLLIGKFQRAISSPVRVPELEVQERAAQSLATVSLDYVAFDMTAYLDDLQLSDEEVASYAETADERLRTLYDGRKTIYNTPERVRARHILFAGEDTDARAEAAAARLASGEDFGDLARELSDDRGTRTTGGELGFFPRGRMDPAFEEAAFALEVGGISKPVQSNFGVHLIELEERQAARSRSYEEARPELARELLRGQRARSLAQAAASEFALAIGQGADFDEVAREADVEIQNTGPFRYTDPTIPRLGQSPGIREAAFATETPGTASNQVFPLRSRFVLIRLASRHAPEGEELEIATEQIREQLRRGAQQRVVNRWVDEAVETLQQEGKVVLYPLYATAN